MCESLNKVERYPKLRLLVHHVILSWHTMIGMFVLIMMNGIMSYTSSAQYAETELS